MAPTTLRPLTIADAPAMTAVLASPDLYTHTGGKPPTEAELTALYTRQVVGRSSDGAVEWMNWIVFRGEDGDGDGDVHADADDGHVPIGYVQTTRPTGSTTASIAWVIGKPWQRKGHATAAVRLMVDELARRGVAEVTAYIHPENVASVRLARRIGMCDTGVVEDGEVCWVGKVGKGELGNAA